MPIEPSNDALTTVVNARSHLGKTDTDPVQSDNLQLLINAFSRAIRLYTGRQFLPLEDNVTRRFRYEGSGFLSLAPYELRSVSSVTLYTDLPVNGQEPLNPETTLSESLYRLEPRMGTYENTFVWMVLPEIGMFSPLVPEPLINRRARGHEVTISGDWGAGTVPGDVQFACLIAVANAFRNPEGFATRSLAGFAFGESVETTVADDVGRSLPRDARALLAPYKRRAFG